jgi:hypothetical protein
MTADTAAILHSINELTVCVAIIGGANIGISLTIFFRMCVG